MGVYDDYQDARERMEVSMRGGEKMKVGYFEMRNMMVSYLKQQGLFLGTKEILLMLSVIVAELQDEQVHLFENKKSNPVRIKGVIV
jgi:hypothetical protein